MNYSHVKQIITEQSMHQTLVDKFQLLESAPSYSQRVQAQDITYPLISNCPAMQEIYDGVRSVAPTKSTVLLSGETGTGKGVIARLIHQHSTRRNEPFICVHCGAIPDTLLESELFGHEKGSFTGAVKKKAGKFEIAHGGTIFLDEIGTLTPSAQIKLLQVLQDGIFQRIGKEQNTWVNVRIIAATNENLKQLCQEQKFRNDLYYRLNVFPLELPPLRRRKEDIPVLARVFIQRFNRLYNKSVRDIHPLVIEAFLRYSWPGNIRELENLLERACILERSSILLPESFPGELFSGADSLSRIQMNTMLPLAEIRKRGVEEIERCYLKEVLATHSGIIHKSAETAGITTRQLHKLMKKYGFKKEEFKN